MSLSLTSCSQRGMHSEADVLSELNDIIDNVMAVMSQGRMERLFTAAEHMHAHTLVYNCSTRKMSRSAPKLYGLYVTKLQEFLNARKSVALQSPCNVSSVAQMWLEYKTFVRWMQKVFLYLDRFYVHHDGQLSLTQRAYAELRTAYLDSILIELKLCLIAEDTVWDSAKIKPFIDSLEAINRASDVEPTFLDMMIRRGLALNVEGLPRTITLKTLADLKSADLTAHASPQHLFEGLANVLVSESSKSTDLCNAIAVLTVCASGSTDLREAILRNHPLLNAILVHSRVTTGCSLSDKVACCLRAIGYTKRDLESLHMLTLLCCALDDRVGAKSPFSVLPTIIVQLIYRTLNVCKPAYD